MYLDYEWLAIEIREARIALEDATHNPEVPAIDRAYNAGFFAALNIVRSKLEAEP